ncbi:hypothetical protein [Sphingomicrobium marinum]|uniref:hypothetical protein n=1 Tax=Sphingomicrobium marinum TaxID=1227950 RepID=UPI002ACD3612|nr:hypothetical protein [Sphingomicrobium marinum]
MLKKIGRLFTIKTRFEALLVTYAIAVGAISRGQAYLTEYPGIGGWLLFACCLGLPFLAGAKLLDSVRKSEPRKAPVFIEPRRRRTAVRHRRNRRVSDTPRTESRRRA